jgi:hypothetical protein
LSIQVRSQQKVWERSDKEVKDEVREKNDGHEFGKRVKVRISHERRLEGDRKLRMDTLCSIYSQAPTPC